MNPFDINQAGGSMNKSVKKKATPRRDKRKVWVTFQGKRQQTTARGARILRAVRVLKGLSPD